MVLLSNSDTHASVSLLPFALDKCARHDVFEYEGNHRFCRFLCEDPCNSMATPGEDWNAESMAAGRHPCVSIEREREQAWSCGHYTLPELPGRSHQRKQIIEVQERDYPLHHVEGAHHSVGKHVSS